MVSRIDHKVHPFFFIFSHLSFVRCANVRKWLSEVKWVKMSCVCGRFCSVVCNLLECNWQHFAEWNNNIMINSIFNITQSNRQRSLERWECQWLLCSEKGATWKRESNARKVKHFRIFSGKRPHMPSNYYKFNFLNPTMKKTEKN